MPRAKKPKVDDADEVDAFATLQHKIDTNALEHIVLLAEPDTLTHNALLELQIASKGLSRVTMRYIPSKEFPEGRVYSAMTNLCGKARRFLCSEYHHDIDIVNACPTIAHQVFTKLLGPDCFPMLSAYVEPGGRVLLIQKLQEKYPVELGAKTFNEMKNLFLKGIHRGSYPESPLMKLIPELAKWTKSFSDLTMKLVSYEPYNSFWAVVQADKKNKNPIGTFVSRVWQYNELKCLKSIMDYFDVYGAQTKNKVEVLIHDGTHVSRTVEGSKILLDESLLRGCEAYILKSTQLIVQLAEKNLTPTASDWKWFWGECILTKLKGEERFRYLVRMEGQRNNLRRMEGWTMEMHPRIPGVYRRSEECIPFARRVLKLDQKFLASGNMETIVKWFDNVPHEKFKLLESHDFDVNVVSFTDGFYKLQEQEFVSWEGNDNKPPVTNHFFDEEFPRDHATRTKRWDAMLLYQLSPEEKEILEALIGRLYFKQGALDNWQVSPFVLGDADTGKGTIYKVILAISPAGSIGTIMSNYEAQFGLEALISKRIIAFPDLFKNIAAKLPQDQFQSMVSAETVSVARKNRPAIPDYLWQIGVILFGNSFPGYADENGSISRRLATFKFETLIKDEMRDTDLLGKIIKEEGSSVLINCIAAYLKLTVKYKGKGFWSFAPESMDATRISCREETNHLASFISNGSKYYQIVFDEGVYTPYTELETAFQNYMRFDRQNSAEAKLGTDLNPIKIAGFIHEVRKNCKVCVSEYSKCACVPKKRQNRVNAVYFKHMRIVKRGDQPIVLSGVEVECLPEPSQQPMETIPVDEDIAEMKKEVERSKEREVSARNAEKLARRKRHQDEMLPPKATDTLEAAWARETERPLKKARKIVIPRAYRSVEGTLQIAHESSVNYKAVKAILAESGERDTSADGPFPDFY